MACAKGSLVGGNRAMDSEEAVKREESADIDVEDEDADVGRVSRRPSARCWVARGPLRSAVLANFGTERSRACRAARVEEPERAKDFTVAVRLTGLELKPSDNRQSSRWAGFEVLV